jgi:hypothetical protein
MALFQTCDPIYDLEALNLAAITTGSNLEIIYFGDTGDYFAVTERLRKIGVPFLLIEVYEDHKNKSGYQPSVQFSTALFNKMKLSYIDPPGFKRMASFKLNGGEQVLFKVLPF